MKRMIFILSAVLVLFAGCGQGNSSIAINSITPSGGSTRGGTTVVVGGVGYDDNMSITFGGVANKDV